MFFSPFLPFWENVVILFQKINLFDEFFLLFSIKDVKLCLSTIKETKKLIEKKSIYRLSLLNCLVKSESNNVSNKEQKRRG